MNRKRWFTFFCILVVLMLLVSSGLVYGRAGGGHGTRSSSSGSHSSGGRSSWSGSGSPSFGYGVPVYGAHSYGSRGSCGSGLVVLIVLVIIGVVIYRIYRNFQNQTSSYDDGTGTPAGPEQGYSLQPGMTPRLEPAPDLAAKIQQLKEKDPGFNEQVFQDKVSTAFFKIQHAWCSRDISLAQDLISEAVLMRFTMQIEEYRNQRIFNKLDQLSLDKVEILDLQSDERYDTIDVWITATARDYNVHEDGSPVTVPGPLSTWDEKWSFMRSTKARTPLKEGAESAKCPNCGSPVRFNAVGECEYCHSNLTKYDFDWVLAEITQLNV